jgi:hypothetical protein
VIRMFAEIDPDDVQVLVLTGSERSRHDRTFILMDGDWLVFDGLSLSHGKVCVG